jgi:two-component system, OmpR family, phosphate regulon sensor histidine kinase PhoR
MNYKKLRILSYISALSLLGIIITQSFWLRKTLNVAERQFDHRANQLLNDVVEELRTYSDTSAHIQEHLTQGNLRLFDVIDTVLLYNLIYKYAVYHQLDTTFYYALIETSTGKVIYNPGGFQHTYEKETYKACLSCLWKEEYIHLSVFFPNKEKNIFEQLTLWVGLSGLFLSTTVSAFIFIIYNFYKQKRLSEIKNDFINNMTHELKTPLSTISVASEVLMNTSSENKDNRISRYSKIIFNENQRMRKLVDKVLHVAAIDRELLSIDKEEINITKTIYQVVEGFCFEACPGDIKVSYKFNATDKTVFADKLHLRNILNNLVDNAVKYSGKNSEIIIKTETVESYLKISVSDKGKGIPKESLNRVFDKFYRVPSGNVHNVKGFGLGLYYVKTMVELHNGKIEIHSNLHKGTTTSIFLPL